MLTAGLALVSLLLALPAVTQARLAPVEQADIPPLVWELVELKPADGAAIEILDPSRYTVRFLPEGKLALGAGCNLVAGTFTAQYGTLTVALKALPLPLCPLDSQAVEFQSLVDDASAYAFDRNGFLLLTGDEGRLKLRASLAGVVWEWRDFRGGNDELIQPDDPGNYTVSFLADGKLAIKADCSRATGSYTVDGPKIDLMIGGVIRMKCPPGSLMDRYLQDLGDATSHVFREGDLYLALPVDAGIMAFAARYEEPVAATATTG